MNQWALFFLFLFLFGIFFFPSISSKAISPDCISPAVVCLDTSYKFFDTTDKVNVSWTQNLYMKQLDYGNDNINFTDVSVASPNNPIQTFGVDLKKSGGIAGNLSITNIDSNNVYFSVSPFNASNPNLFYNYFANPVPPQVTVSSTVILQADYFLVPASYNACTAPCVLLNTTNSFIEIKTLAPQVNPVIVCTLTPCLTIEPVGSTDLLLIIFAVVIALIMMIIGLKFNNPFPALVAALVLLVMYLGLNSAPTIVYGQNQIALPTWFTEVFILFIVVAFVYTFYLIFKWRHR